jgi:hypothetical protein
MIVLTVGSWGLGRVSLQWGEVNGGPTHAYTLVYSSVLHHYVTLNVTHAYLNVVTLSQYRLTREKLFRRMWSVSFETVTLYSTISKHQLPMPPSRWLKNWRTSWSWPDGGKNRNAQTYFIWPTNREHKLLRHLTAFIWLSSKYSLLPIPLVMVASSRQPLRGSLDTSVFVLHLDLNESLLLAPPAAGG